MRLILTSQVLYLMWNGTVRYTLVWALEGRVPHQCEQDQKKGSCDSPESHGREPEADHDTFLPCARYDAYSASTPSISKPRKQSELSPFAPASPSMPKRPRLTTCTHSTGEYVHEGPIETPPVLLNALAQLKPPSGEIGTLQQKGSEPISTIKTYTGSCYCSAVFFAVKTPPLSQVEIKEDNCSICVRVRELHLHRLFSLSSFRPLLRSSRLTYLFTHTKKRAATTIYPDQDQVLFHLSGQVLGAGSINEANSATTDTTTYAFGRKFNQFPFCKTCGVACFGIPVGPPPEVVSRLPPEKQMFVEKLRRIRPLYLRAMNDVEWDEIDVVRSDEGAEGYVVGAEIPDNEAKDESDC